MITIAQGSPFFSLRSVTALSACLAACLCPGQSQAQQRSTPANDGQCAVYGSGFVAVQGTGSCVRIGGRVRLELNAGRIGNAYAPGGLNQNPAPVTSQSPFGAAQAPGDGLNRVHMRLGGPMAGARR